jgi:uncharacterized protein (TIGR03437 family)
VGAWSAFGRFIWKKELTVRKPLFILAAFASVAFAQTQTVSYSYSGLPAPVYPNDWNTWSIISIFVPKSLTVTKVTVSAQVQYNGVGDLNVYLWSAAGTRTKLLERNCGGLQNIDTTFDDSAPVRFSNACPPPGGGSYQGNEPLANSVGQNAYGYWRLGVENNGSDNTGLFTGYTITITGTTLSPPFIGNNTVLSTSSFNGGAVAPGDQVSIFGTNLGPTPGVTAGAGTLPTSLSGTTVTFDGVPAPLFFVSGGYIAAQAPTTLTPGATTNIKVTASTGSTNSVSLPVVAANPGIFTIDVGGSGQAKATNADGTENGDGTIFTTDEPAPRGSVIAVYASGLGALNPAIAAGTPAPSSPLSTVSGVTATIGLQPATVMYAGSAPGLIGVYQVNIQVPLTAASGNNRIVLTVGGNSSQAGVTIAVK